MKQNPSLAAHSRVTFAGKLLDSCPELSRLLPSFHHHLVASPLLTKTVMSMSPQTSRVLSAKDISSVNRLDLRTASNGCGTLHTLLASSDFPGSSSSNRPFRSQLESHSSVKSSLMFLHHYPLYILRAPQIPPGTGPARHTFAAMWVGCEYCCMWGSQLTTPPTIP